MNDDSINFKLEKLIQERIEAAERFANAKAAFKAQERAYVRLLQEIYDRNLRAMGINPNACPPKPKVFKPFPRIKPTPLPLP